MVQTKPQECRTVFHIDMDAFFASVEIARNPELKGKAVIVGGQPNTRGVVSTCSYEARKFGVHSAMSLTEAYRRCPHGIFIDGSFSLYRDYSHKIMEIFSCYTDYLEVVSVDEAYLDVTEYGLPELLAKHIKKSVFDQTQLTCSIGIATNKLVAKIASSKNKPDGLCIVQPGQEAAFLAPLPIHALPGIGEKTRIPLNRDGFSIIEDLQKRSMEDLIHLYGGFGYYCFLAAHGKDNRPVEEDTSPPKSIGSDTTFEKDISDRTFLKETLMELLEKIHKKMCREKMRAGSVAIRLRYSDFKTINRSRSLFSHTNRLDEIKKVVLHLFETNYSDGDLPLRLIGVCLEKLTSGYWQPTFWD